MWPTNWQPISKVNSEGFVELVAEKTAQIQEFQLSHSQLLVRFFERPNLDGVYLYCKGCDSVSFLPTWTCEDLKVQFSNSGPSGCLITCGNEFKVKCSIAFFVEVSSEERVVIPGLGASS